MSEKRKIQRFNLDEGRIWEAIEGLSPFKTTYTLEEVCEKLNEQQATINELKEENDKLIQKNCIPCELVNSQTREIDKLKEENEQLRKELGDCEKFRYSVFKGMEKTLEEKKNDDGGFQVWEVPPIPQGKRISFTTNNDGGDE